MNEDTRFEVRRLSPPDAVSFRDLRLASLKAHPEAFGASWEEEAPQHLAWFAARLDRSVVLGGKLAGASEFQGLIAYYIADGAKQRHKGVLWSVFVQPEARGTGLAHCMLARVLDHARVVVEELRLSVVATNIAAIRLYERAGFERYGVEPRGLKIGEDYHDEVHMALSLGRPCQVIPRHPDERLHALAPADWSFILPVTGMQAGVVW